MFDGREVGWNARNASSGGEPLSAPPYATECAMTLDGTGSVEGGKGRKYLVSG